MSTILPPPSSGQVPKPYYEDDLVTLYHGDCREIAAWLEADVLVTDPPFGRAWRQGALGGRQRPNGWTPGSQADDGIANDFDTTARDEVLNIWGGRLAVVFGDLMLAPPQGTRQVLLYKKPSSAGVRGATAGHRRDVEAVYLIGPWPSGIGGDSSVIEAGFANVASGPAAVTGHPHAKSIVTMEHLVGLADGVVADPFAGSGSTLCAAKNMGRPVIGVEIEERYCEIAAKRLCQDVLDFGEATA